MLGIEVVMLAVLILGYEGITNLSVDDICLRMQAIVIIPSEFVYERQLHSSNNVKDAPKRCMDDFKRCSGEYCSGFFIGCLPCCCCFTPAICLSSLFCFRKKESYRHPSIRIGLSFMEWIFVIIWAIAIPERSKFLFSFNYGLVIFIVSGICYFIHTQYLYFFPDFSLPGKVSIRSIHGYSFNGELEELQRVRTPKGETRPVFWNGDKLHTPAMYALSMGHHRVVEYLVNEKGAKDPRREFGEKKDVEYVEYAKERLGILHE